MLNYWEAPDGDVVNSPQLSHRSLSAAVRDGFSCSGFQILKKVVIARSLGLKLRADISLSYKPE